MHDQPTNSTEVTDTSGGAYIRRDVHTGGDFVGRDQVFQGDAVHGDKIGHDKVTIGAIINNFVRGDAEETRKLRNRQERLTFAPFKGFTSAANGFHLISTVGIFRDHSGAQRASW